jgi:hypothetical protein
MKILEEQIQQLKEYEEIIKQMRKILETEGKSSSVIHLMQGLTNRDIGMICWRVGADWKTAGTDQVQQLKPVLQELSQEAALIKNLTGKESGLPTLTLFAEQVSKSVNRVLHESSTPGISVPQDRYPAGSKEGIFKRLFGSFFSKGPDIKQLIESHDIQGLLAALNHRNKSIRAESASALGQVGGEQVVDALTLELNDKSEEVREAAATALKSIGGGRAEAEVEKYRERVKEERINRLRNTIGRFISSGNVNGLIHILEDKDLDYVLEDKVIDALMNLGMEALVPLLQALGDQRRINGMIEARNQGLLNKEVVASGISFAARDYRRRFEK